MTIHTYTEVADSSRFAQLFSALPEEVRKAPYRKGLLPAEIWHSFLHLPLASPKEFWIITEGAATLSRIGANVSSQDPDTGYVGFLEFDPENTAGREAAEMLIDAACAFLKGQGVKKIYGPVQISTWFPYRYRLTNEDQRFFAWEPVDPPAYLDVFISAGFEEAEGYNSTSYGDLEVFLGKLEPAYTSALAKGYQIRPFDRSAGLDKELPVLHQMSQAAFQDSFLFEAIPYDIFKALYVPIADKMQQHSKIIMSPEGKAVGFLFGFMDEHLDGEKGVVESYFVIKSLAVVPEARGKGLSSALVYAAVREGLGAGASYAVSAMVRSGIASESFQKKGSFFWQHQYGLFGKGVVFARTQRNNDRF